MSSVDGRLIPSRWTQPFDGTPQTDVMACYAVAARHLDTDAWMFGKATLRETVPARYMSFTRRHPKAGTVYRGNLKSDRLFIVVDPDADIRFSTDTVRDDNIIVILGRNATTDYLSMLEHIEVSYVVTENPTDLRRGMELVGEHFGVKSVSLQGGGIINGAMLAAGLVDELSLLVYPGIDGLTTSPSIFEYLGASDEYPACGQSLELLSSRTLDHGVVWLRYRLHHGED